MPAVKKNTDLVVESSVTHEQLENARRLQKQVGGDLNSALIKLGYMKEKDVSVGSSGRQSVPPFELDQFEIPADALNALTMEVCLKHRVIPVSKAGDTLVVAFADPSNLAVRDDLRFVSKCKIEVVVAHETMIVKAIGKYYKKEKNVKAQVDELEETEEAFAENTATQAQALSDNEGESPIIKFVNSMLVEAVNLKASDIHIEPYEKRLRIRYRIDGMLIEKIQPPSGVGASLTSRIKIMSKLDISERRRPQDGRIKIRLTKNTEVDFRVSILPTMFGEKIVMRILDKSNLKVDMTQLGFEQAELDLFRSRIAEPQGMVLVTGPTGSGKTTTLYSALQSLNDPGVNLSTAEDPVEFNLDGINQVQINHEIDFGFPEALRSFLRQDPDVILVGEIRDLETAEIAFKAANTGHLVLSTLHTNDAPATISRLLDMGIPGYLITTTLNLIVAQRLAGRVCKNCAIPQDVNEKILLEAGLTKDELPGLSLFRGEGCTTCNGSGIKGRVALFEVMQMSGPLREIVLKQGTPIEIKKAAIRGGMKTLRQAALTKMKTGLIPLEEVLATTLGDDQI